MKAHDLGQQLLGGPDLPVVIPTYDEDDAEQHVEVRTNEPLEVDRNWFDTSSASRRDAAVELSSAVAEKLSAGDKTGAALAASELASHVNLAATFWSRKQLEVARDELLRALLATERVLEAEEVVAMATQIAANQQALAIGAVAQATSAQVAIDELHSVTRSRLLEAASVRPGSPVEAPEDMELIPVHQPATEMATDPDTTGNEGLLIASDAVLLAARRAAAAAEQAKSLLAAANSKAATAIAKTVRLAAAADQSKADGEAIKVAAAASDAADLVTLARVGGHEVEDEYKAARVAATVAAAALATAENTAHTAEQVANAASAAATAAAAMAADAAMALELEVASAAAEVEAAAHTARIAATAGALAGRTELITG